MSYSEKSDRQYLSSDESLTINTDINNLQAKRIIVSGKVQGVGYRPFIYHHATSLQLTGWVRNTSGRVEIHIQGLVKNLTNFENSLLDSSPSISKPLIDNIHLTNVIDTHEFLILESYTDIDSDIHLPTDIYTCPDCVNELYDTNNRRYRYPFINCTQCGPRYTIIKSLPYDRKNTSMANFEFCSECKKEYSDPNNRRYHAEPSACETCGPCLTYISNNRLISGNSQVLVECINDLLKSKIIAIKGVGGYHLVCDARDDKAVLKLRDKKPRAEKPLAIMISDNDINKYLELSSEEKTLLTSSVRPIVLVDKLKSDLSRFIAPGMSKIGVMLAYSPLHYLLLNDYASPLVFTSANISGEPVLTDNNEVESRLCHVADTFLHHNRQIVRPVDDSVFHIISSVPRPVRLGRGISPLELELPVNLPEPVLAVGCHMKNTVALGWGNRVVISAHIGEMNNPRSMQTFENCINDLQSIYKVKAEHILCDAHKDYSSSRWARKQDLKVSEIFHHHAHASACWFEASSIIDDLNKILVFTWDGVGLGVNGDLWGGEALLGSPGCWNRVSHFRPFKLPGGELAGRQPWRSAAALCWESGLEFDGYTKNSDLNLLYNFWQQGKNAPTTTSVGRLFDAASALTCLCEEVSFEGQGPMMLEAVADVDVEPIDMEISTSNDVLIVDWQYLIPMLKDKTKSQSYRAGCFHSSMATSLLNQALILREKKGINVVGLSGGVFQNKLLTENVFKLLIRNKFQVFMPEKLPVNDAGISFGQIVEYMYSQSGDS